MEIFHGVKLVDSVKKKTCGHGVRKWKGTKLVYTRIMAMNIFGGLFGSNLLNSVMSEWKMDWIMFQSAWFFTAKNFL